MDGCTDANVGGAPANITVHREVDVAIRRCPVKTEERSGAHDLTACRQNMGR
jgi:hypothetical protein